VNFEIQAFREPFLELGFGWSECVAKDADGCSAIDLLELFQNGAEILLVTGMIAHVIDAERDDDIDAGFPDPLRRGEFWGGGAWVKGVVLVQIGETIAVSGLGGSAGVREGCAEGD
jgi:hypothetical protein